MVSTNGLILRLQKYNFFFFNDTNLKKNEKLSLVQHELPRIEHELSGIQFLKNSCQIPDNLCFTKLFTTFAPVAFAAKHLAIFGCRFATQVPRRDMVGFHLR